MGHARHVFKVFKKPGLAPPWQHVMQTQFSGYFSLSNLMVLIQLTDTFWKVGAIFRPKNLDIRAKFFDLDWRKSGTQTYYSILSDSDMEERSCRGNTFIESNGMVVLFVLFVMDWFFWRNTRKQIYVPGNIDVPLFENAFQCFNRESTLMDLIVDFL